MAASPTPNTAADDRFCDLVLEGGITSGIVYSAAIVELAKVYRFARIGGSSIGAFAAALAAAAEYARRRGSMTGFDALAALPDDLAEEDAAGRTRLERLFRAQPCTRRLFEVFRSMLGDHGSLRKAWETLWTAQRQYWKATLAGIVVVVLLAAAPVLWYLGAGALWATQSTEPWPMEALLTWAGATAVLVAGVPLLMPLFGIVWDLNHGLVRNGFGLCRGWNLTEGDDPDLAGYLHMAIQRVAGLDPAHDAPLTFQDLHDAPGGPAERFGDARQRKQPSIGLEVYATNLAHGRPYRFPLEPRDDMGRLFYREEELRAYFPRTVIDHLRKVSDPYKPAGPSDPPADAQACGLRELPADRLPVVVAARLAMSFPLLLSAVPLHAIDYEARRGERKVKRCWISDGGLCSNFPIHLFDAFVPRWPTFGIALGLRNKYQKDAIWLPKRHFEGRADCWHRGIDADEVLDPHRGGASRLLAFLVALWKSAWHWNDSTMMRMPGVRDRVVRVFLQRGEGGINIRMPASRIRRMPVEYGRPAAKAFIAKFAQPGSPGWDEHRWVRFNRLLIALRDQIECLDASASFSRHTVPLDDQICRARLAAPLRGHSGADERAPSEVPLTPLEACDLKQLLGALIELQTAFERHDAAPYHAVPRPALRVRHPT